MNKIKQDKTFWLLTDRVGNLLGEADCIDKRGITVYQRPNEYFSASEWDSLCAWVAERRKEGWLWEEKT